MSTSVSVPIPRCCHDHRDWATLADHLLDDFADVPASAILRELLQVRQASELFGLELPDALDCAELIVRTRSPAAPAPAPA